MRGRGKAVAVAGALGAFAVVIAVAFWPRAATRADTSVHWIAVGGGADPASNQVSMEEDVALASQVLGPNGLLLFAGGPGSSGVQEQDRVPRGDPLVGRLAGIFAPRGGRDATYRALQVPVAGRSTELLRALEEALARGKGPLTVFVAAHGDRGETPADTSIAVWGGWTVFPVDLAQLLDAASDARPVRFVITSCHSGGFADLLFAQADPEQGAAPGERCGLFSTTWEREASGCDPNPDRAAHESYSIHFLHALRGKDREGKPLFPAIARLDGARGVSLLEAHTAARVTSRSLDVPTTTSERWLREVAPAAGEGAPVSLPEEEFVIGVLRELTGLDEAAARTAFDAVTARLATMDQEVAQAEEAVADTYRALAADMLARWPVIDDPYHPDYAATLATHRQAITEFLDGAATARAFDEANAALHTLDDARAQLLVESAPVERLVRAHDNVALAGRLAARGGRDWEVFERLRRCERGMP